MQYLNKFLTDIKMNSDIRRQLISDSQRSTYLYIQY